MNSKINNRANRFISMTATLLLSNLMAITCAMAIDTPPECPNEAPAHCVNMFTDLAAVSVDTSPNEKAGSRPDNTPFCTTELSSAPRQTASKLSIQQWPPDAAYSSPPINLLNCVFLK